MIIGMHPRKGCAYQSTGSPFAS